jgi:hypothetical protein
MRSIHTAELILAMALPPGSAAAFTDHSGFTYQLFEAAKGLSSVPPEEPPDELPPEELEELLLEELEELELLLDELELLLEELDELELLEEELELEEEPPSPFTLTGTGETLPGVPRKPIFTWPPGGISSL